VSANPDNVKSLEDLVAFIHRLRAEDQSAWENPTTDMFLEALAAWIESNFLSEGTPMHRLPRPEPSWSAFALMLTAATAYE